MYDRVLLPTDGSARMASAVRHCFHQARTNDAVVHALYVVDARSYAVLPDETRAQVRSLLAEEGRRAVERIARLGDERDVDVVTAVEEGVPHEAILAYADREDVDVIVMGTHGRTGEARRALGSVAEEVVRASEVPVLTVRMRAEDVADDPDVTEEQLRYVD